MTIGKKIRALRHDRGCTQEKLANHLLVSYQAVSKWEQDLTTPDIQLLPKIAAYFGVTVDNLLALETDTQFERIENMLLHKEALSERELYYATQELITALQDEKTKAKAYGLLAALENHKALAAKKAAADYAKKAIALAPEEKGHHVALVEAMNGIVGDWNQDHHQELISFYQDFTKENPTYERGKYILLNQLLADHRLIEAKDYITDLADPLRKDFYEAKLLCLEDPEKGLSSLEKMVTDHADHWLAHSLYADELARLGQHQEAIEANNRAFTLQESPKYIDAFLCNSLLYEREGKSMEAAKELEKAIQALHDEWQISFGRPVESLEKRIQALKKD